MEKAISKTPIERDQIACFLGLYAPAPEGAPKDWYHHGGMQVSDKGGIIWNYM